ncbi:hypothetical protein AB9K41_00040, partial [Cribrihabitans sp. XS_ASV171]
GEADGLQLRVSVIGVSHNAGERKRRGIRAEQLGQIREEFAWSSAKFGASLGQRLRKTPSVIRARGEAFDVDADHTVEKGAGFSRCDFREVEFPDRQEILARSSLLVKNRHGRRTDALRCDI